MLTSPNSVQSWPLGTIWLSIEMNPSNKANSKVSTKKKELTSPVCVLVCSTSLQFFLKALSQSGNSQTYHAAFAILLFGPEAWVLPERKISLVPRFIRARIFWIPCPPLSSFPLHPFSFQVSDWWCDTFSPIARMPTTVGKVLILSPVSQIQFIETGTAKKKKRKRKEEAFRKRPNLLRN